MDWSPIAFSIPTGFDAPWRDCYQIAAEIPAEKIHNRSFFKMLNLIPPVPKEKFRLPASPAGGGAGVDYGGREKPQVYHGTL